MKLLLKVFCFLLLPMFIGCAQLNIPFFGKPLEEAAIIEKPDVDELEILDSNDLVYKGRIVDAQRLELGRNIAFFPFKAGEGVEATDELDKIALTIIKGASDAFDDASGSKRGHFSLLMADDSRSPDLIIKGHITNIGKPSKLRRWLLLKNKKLLSVEGKITDARTGEVVLIFDDHAQISGQSQNYHILGQRIGRNIGRYMLSGIK